VKKAKKYHASNSLQQAGHREPFKTNIQTNLYYTKTRFTTVAKDLAAMIRITPTEAKKLFFELPSLWPSSRTARLQDFTNFGKFYPIEIKASEEDKIFTQYIFLPI
jgi:hypothetical protein